MLSTIFGISAGDTKAWRDLARRAGIGLARLKAMDGRGLEPTVGEIQRLAALAGVSAVVLRLQWGLFDRDLRTALAAKSEQIAALVEAPTTDAPIRVSPASVPMMETTLGKLYHGDCLDIMRSLPDASCDLIFADPPFNLDKLYPSRMDDDLRQDHYLEWCEEWLTECVRLVKEGGSLFVYNLPRWNTFLSAFLNRRMTFRHWIAVNLKFSLPVAGRLYPSHYSLLYYVKGDRPRKLVADRLPMEVCPACLTDLRDYGGYKDKMNPRGVNMTDVWNDIPPVRHAKYKKRKGANELSIKLLDRIIEMATDEGDVVLDPFGGSGTTYAVAEMKSRRWIGMEIGPVDEIVDRLRDLSDERAYLAKIRSGYNHLFLPDVQLKREKKGLWTARTLAKKRGGIPDAQPVQMELDE